MEELCRINILRKYEHPYLQTRETALLRAVEALKAHVMKIFSTTQMYGPGNLRKIDRLRPLVYRSVPGTS